MQSRWKSLLDSIQVLHDSAYKQIRERYQEKLLRNLHVVVQFSVMRVVVICILFPRFVKYGGAWVCGVGGFAALFPRHKRALSWVFLTMIICITTAIIYENGEDYFRYGLSHSSSAATLMVFFGGLGARGAALFATALCLLCWVAAPSNVLTVNIGVACLAQVVMCVVLEVSLLQQLAETEKLVEEMRAIDEKKANFMAIVSHELKSPLHGIIGLSSSLMSNTGGDRPAKKHLALILSCAERLLDMVTNIMDASVLVHDKKMKLSRDLVHFDRIVEDVSLVSVLVVLCRHAVDRNGRPLVRDRVRLINMVGPLPAIEADLQRCTQLMYNLVNNALKFTQVGQVKIYGRAENELGIVTLTVEDTGIGIAGENLERIFQPFDQEDESEHRHYEGLGLGLSICKEVVEKHGGSLTVESVKGKGSKFHATFPFMMQAPSYTADMDSSVAGETSAFGDMSESLGDMSANGEQVDEDAPLQAALQKDPAVGQTNLNPACPEDSSRTTEWISPGSREASPQGASRSSRNKNLAQPIGSSPLSKNTTHASADLDSTARNPAVATANKLPMATIPVDHTSRVEPSVQAGATRSLGLVECSCFQFPSGSPTIDRSIPAAQQTVCINDLKHSQHCPDQEPTPVKGVDCARPLLELDASQTTASGLVQCATGLPAHAGKDVWKPPFQGAMLFDSVMRCCDREQTVSERWQLQKRVAHHALALRHKQRDLNKMQMAIQERALIIDAMGSEQCRSRSTCGSIVSSDVAPCHPPLEELHAAVSGQALELQQKGLDLVSAQVTMHESARCIEALKRDPQCCGNLLEELEKTVAQLVLDCGHQEIVRRAAESAVQHQAEVIRRLQLHRQRRCF